ncbi:MAG: hypothetical protein AB8I08_12185 [Sandaracinaceae bacterium]
MLLSRYARAGEDGPMPAWELIAVGVGGLGAGLVVSALLLQGRLRGYARQRLERDVALRRLVVPVLERRADMLGIPPASRGSDTETPYELVLTLARAIGSLEESADLPFGDTVEVSREDLQGQTPSGDRDVGE